MANPAPNRSPVFESLNAQLSPGSVREYEDEFYKPRPQGFWYHDGSVWTEVSATSTTPRKTTSQAEIQPQIIRLCSWNIDLLVGLIEERMAAALAYLCDLISSSPLDIPIVIFFQEMGDSDLQQIREASWIQERFFITDFDERNWLSPFMGTTTLIDRRLKPVHVFRVAWYSEFDRDGLFVDISLTRSPSVQNEENGKVLRLCNVHLESLVADPPIRPLQLSEASKYLHEENVAAALLAGDLNAIQPFDRILHSNNSLKDAYLELGGKEDSDDGYTWGYQVPQHIRERFGCSRMDKILYKGEIEAKAFERIGMGVKVEESVRERCREEGEQEWVSDHYGVMGDFEHLGGWKLG
ncbi:hypothetical protein CC78DRAFT_523285 [Lojkania enalia]|uniref:Endonuclease/exonuclease/phosphatase domain-containing protein n=1 Tax=Lojkania enalia TaxID=147567 RepID=A0A9P4N395_9PLEO|nr:hypothetical protein CC78DRAFT_523285 [Didymosphaeria enalia]